MATVETEVSEGIFTISFNRPEVHNSFDDEMQDRIYEAFSAAEACRKSSVIILRGNGRSFCAGRDVTKMGERPEGVTHFEFMMDGTKNIHALLSLKKPVIAAIRGGAIGGGCELAMACDMRIASPSAKFALPEIDFGLCVDQGGSALASALIGPSRTKWMLLTGDRVMADTALTWGLVDFIVADEDLDQHVRNLAPKIAAKPKLAVSAAKALVNELWEDDMHAAARREVVQQLALFGSQEFADLREQRRAERAAKAAAASA